MIAEIAVAASLATINVGLGEIIRPHSEQTLRHQSFDVSVDGQPATRISAGHPTSIQVDPGEHEVALAQHAAFSHKIATQKVTIMGDGPHYYVINFYDKQDLRTFTILDVFINSPRHKNVMKKGLVLEPIQNSKGD